MNDQQTTTRPLPKLLEQDYADMKSPIELMAMRERQSMVRRMTGTVKCGGGRRVLGKKPGGDNY